MSSFILRYVWTCSYFPLFFSRINRSTKQRIWHILWRSTSYFHFITRIGKCCRSYCCHTGEPAVPVDQWCAWVSSINYVLASSCVRSYWLRQSVGLQMRFASKVDMSPKSSFHFSRQWGKQQNSVVDSVSKVDIVLRIDYRLCFLPRSCRPSSI